MHIRGRLVTAIVLFSLAIGAGLWPTPTGTPFVALASSDTGVSPAAPISATFGVAADAFIDFRNPDRNIGGSAWVAVGADPANGSVFRGLLYFNVTGIPATAAIVNATLRAYASQGVAGQTIDVHRVRANWMEGAGSGFAYRQPITVTEAAGVARVREPIDLVYDVPVQVSTLVRGDFRVYDDQGLEIPSQVYGPQYDGNGSVIQLHIVFGATVGARQTRTYDLYFGSLLPIVPAYRQVTGQAVLWTRPLGVRYTPLTAVDLDGDGRLEVVVSSSAGTIYAIRVDGSEVWNYPAGGPLERFASVVDVDGDGTYEVVFATEGPSYNVVAIDARNGTFEWQSPVPSGSIPGPGAIADLNGDGISEIYFGSADGNLYALNGSDGQVLPGWPYALGGTFWGIGAAIGDVWGGPEPEIVFTAYRTPQGDIVVLQPDGTFVSRFTPTGPAIRVSPSLGHFDAEPHLDIVASDAAANAAQFAYRADGTQIWLHGTNSDMYGGQILVDFEDDGAFETVFSMTKRGNIRALNADGSERWTIPTGNDVWGAPAAADVDLDGVEEILAGSFDGSLYIIKDGGTTATVIWTSTPDGALVSATPIVADLDGDGNVEVVYASRSATYAITFPSFGHDVRTWGYNHNRTGRFLDGNSPDGAPLLQTSLGIFENLAGSGVTWRTRDGTNIWATPGSDYDASVGGSATVGGSGQWLTWNATSIVQSWTDGTQPNVGFLVRVRNEATPAINSFVSREGDPLFRASLSVVYTDNTAPSISPRVPDQMANEDAPLWTLDLQAFAQDPNTPASRLKWDLVDVNASLYDFSGGNITGNHRFFFQPRPDAWGNDAVTLFLFDDGGNYATQRMWVNITPVNDRPYWAGPPTTLYVKYGSPYTFDFDPYIKDIDTPRSGLALRTDDAIHTSISGFRVTFSYPTNYPDAWDFVVLTVTDDGTPIPLSSSESIAIRLTTDTPPELRVPLPDVTLTEGQSLVNVFDLDDYFYDPDNDALYFTWGAAHVTVTISEGVPQPRNHQVDMQTLGEWWGVESVTFQARDPTGAIIEDTILVTVIPLNDPPVIEWMPPYVVRYDVPYVFNLAPHISDPDNDITQLTITTSIPGNITVQGTVLQMLFPQVLGALTAPYTLPLTIRVSDGIDTTFFPTSVSVTDDYPPQLNGTEIPDVTFFEDEVLLDYLDLDAYFIDTDSTTIFFTSGQRDVQVTIDLTNHSVDFAARPDWFGSEVVTFRAMDDRGAYAEDSIKVTVRPVNDAPYFESLPVINTQDRNFFFSVRAYLKDVDNVESELTVTTSSAYVTIQGFILVFSYPEGVRQHFVNLTVSDGLATGVATLQVEIEGPNLLLMLLPWFLAVAGVVGVFFATRVLRSIVEEVFLIYNSGVPLVHLSRTLKSDKDPDLIASMFTAIQSFMNQSFQSMGVGAVKGIELADHNVAVARGSYVLLVVLYRGHESSRLERRVTGVVEDIEKKYKDVLKNWNGDVDRLGGIKQFLEQLWGAKERGNLLDTFGRSSPPEPPMEEA
ncbi:MAG TPA: DNRLRE domain-containing protein [Thermoplasmata archaeon]|nr:DNRLRE domain-containing protein [Thermoplasmata archaeon]